MVRRFRSFQRGTVGLFRSIGCKDTSCQSWRCDKKFCLRPIWTTQVRPAFDSRTIRSSPNFDSLYLCSQLTYRDPQYLFGKISTSLTCIVSIQSSSRILNTGFAHSKWPHLQRAYVIGGYFLFWLAVCHATMPYNLLKTLDTWTLKKLGCWSIHCTAPILTWTLGMKGFDLNSRAIHFFL